MAGRLRIRLSEMLEDEGLIIGADYIDPAEGVWRNKTLDGMDPVRWWANPKTRRFLDFPPGLMIHLRGFSTMTDCVRYGITIFKADDLYTLSYEVWANNECGTGGPQ